MLIKPDLSTRRSTPRVAVVHEWMVMFAGSERVVQHILRRFPSADLYSVISIMERDEAPELIDRLKGTTFIQRMPWLRKMYRRYLPLMPLAIEQLDLSDYDIIISSNHAVAKGVITGPDQLHISYVHSPMRYAWDMQQKYLKDSGLDRGLKGYLARRMLFNIRMWDSVSANRVDHFLANSHYIKRRIAKTYRREADVIYPPVDLEWFSPEGERSDYYVTASRLVPYKQAQLVVETFSKMPDRRLVVIGDGPEMNRIKRMATPNIELLGHQPNEALREHMRRARAFVFAAEEDFGIMPIEAQACGAPIIAFGRGGSTETVLPFGTEERPSGILFDEQTAASLAAAIDLFEANEAAFSPQASYDNAMRFSAPRFEKEISEYILKKWDEWLGANSRALAERTW
jgi:glycosyltransferase involved in cell wall biosynthesis